MFKIESRSPHVDWTDDPTRMGGGIIDFDNRWTSEAEALQACNELASIFGCPRSDLRVVAESTLSMAAQAALDAYGNACRNEVGTAAIIGYERRGIAAAFYAVAHHLPNDRRQLAAIADELGG